MIRVARAGLLTTVQDCGRRGLQRHGVVVGGALDETALRIVNLLVCNDRCDAVLEVTMVGPQLELHDEHLLALGGGDLGAQLDGRVVPLWRPFVAPRGSMLVFGARRSGCRAYVGVAGGIDVPAVLGSRATDLSAGFGGISGRALTTGDTVAIGAPGDGAQRRLQELRGLPHTSWGAGPGLIPHYAAEPVLRIVAGPEHARFTDVARALLVTAPFTVTPQSNRMGYRLSGPRLTLEQPLELISSPVTAGTIQVPPTGEPIVLMADRQTTGGYPRIAHVITVDLPLLAQAPPGASVRFREVSLAEAQSLYLTRERDFRLFADALGHHHP